MICSSYENPIDSLEMSAQSQELQDDEFRHDLRDMVQMYDRSQWYLVRQEKADNYYQCICHAQPAVCHMMLDDDKVDWSNHYDPDIDILFGKGGIPDQAWSGDNIFNNTEKETPKVIRDQIHLIVPAPNSRPATKTTEMYSQSEGANPVVETHEDFIARHFEDLKARQLNRLAVFSKVKFSSELSDDELLDQFTKRYHRALPLKSIDCVLVHDLCEKPDTPEQMAQDDVNSQDKDQA
jgi:hypothetical protein